MWNMEQPTGDLIERLRQLEHQQAQLQRAHRRLKLMTGGVVLVAGALVLMAQAAPQQIKSVEAQEFVLIGSDGKVRGAMGITSDGAVGLNFSDAWLIQSRPRSTRSSRFLATGSSRRIPGEAS